MGKARGVREHSSPEHCADTEGQTGILEDHWQQLGGALKILPSHVRLHPGKAVSLCFRTGATLALYPRGPLPSTAQLSAGVQWMIQMFAEGSKWGRRGRRALSN